MVLTGITVVLVGGTVEAAWHPGEKHTSHHEMAAAKPRLDLDAATGTAPPVTSSSPVSPGTTGSVAAKAAAPAVTPTMSAGPTRVPAIALPQRATTVVYTVKPGDTLSTIAAWFTAHGYGPLYSANKAVIGSNPNLIFPGERIVIRGGVMSLQSPAS